MGPMKKEASAKECLASVLNDTGKQAPTRFAIIGLGRAGHFHLNSIRLVGSTVAKVSWVADINEEICKKVSQEYGCKYTTDPNSIFSKDDIDAVIIASTTDTHFEYCKMGLQARKPVFTEKPISHDPAEVKEIVDLAGQTKVPFIVGFQRRCDKNFRRMKNLIDQGEIGEPRVIRCTSRDNPVPPMAYLATSGGIFHDMLSHDFDMIHYLTGQIPEEVYSVGHCYDERIAKMNDADTVIVTMKFASGLMATVDTSRIAAYGYDQRVEVFGDKGMVNTRNEHEDTVELANASGHLTPVAEWSFPQRYKHTYTIELAEFCAMVRSTPMVIEEEAIVSRHIPLEAVATAAELSWKLKRTVRLDEVDSLRHHLHPNGYSH